MDRRDFFLSAAATGATALAASVALRTPDESRLVLGERALAEYDNIRRNEQPPSFAPPLIRVDVYDRKVGRWLTIIQVPVGKGQTFQLNGFDFQHIPFIATDEGPVLVDASIEGVRSEYVSYRTRAFMPD